MPSSPLWSLGTLRRLAEHPQPVVRRWAVERLADHFGEDRKARQVITARISDRDPAVAAVAMQGAGMLDLRRCTDAILARFRSAEGELANVAALTLAVLGDDRLVDAVREKEAGGRLPVEDRVATWLALGGLPLPGARDYLLEAWQAVNQQDDPLVVETLVHALVMGQDATAVRVVTRALLADHSQWIRESVIEGLLPLTDHPMTAGELRRLAMGRSPEASRRIIQPALRQLCTLLKPEAVRELTRAWVKGHAERLLHMLARTASDLRGLSGLDPLTPLAGGSLAILTVLADEPEAIARLGRTRQRELACLGLLALDRVRHVVGVAAVQPPEDPRDLLRLLLSGEPDPLLVDTAFPWLSDVGPSRELIATCLGALAGSRAETQEVACRLLGAWQVSEAIPALVTAIDADSEVADAAVDALAAMREAGLAGARALLEQETHPRRIEAGLELCARVPCRLAVDLLTQNFERLWRIDPDAVLAAVEVLGSRELIAPLERELRAGERGAERVYVLLAELHGHQDPRLDAIRRELTSPDAEFRADRLPLALRCRSCGRTYTYDVEAVYVDPGQPHQDPLIADAIRCKGCGAAEEYELTTRARAAIAAALLELIEAGPGAADLERSVIKLARIGLQDGRHMTPIKALADYEARLAETPDDPALHVGYANVLRALKRPDTAEAAYRRALALDPHAAEAHAALGLLAAERGDFREAARAMERAVPAISRGHLYRVADPDDFSASVRQTLDEFRRRAAIRLPAPEPVPDEVPAAARTKVGRNAPCPCGSGKKYKRCCLSTEPLAAEPALTGPEARLRKRLLEFTERLPGREQERAVALFWGTQFDAVNRTLALEEDEEEVSFWDWLLYDYRLQSTGRRIVEEVLARHAHTLSSDERAILAEWQDAPMGLYEVVGVEPGQALTIRDLWNGATHRIRDIRGSRTAARWDVVAARLIRVRGEVQLSGAALRFPPSTKSELLRHVDERFRAWATERPGASLTDFLGTETLLFHHFARDYTGRCREQWMRRGFHTAEGHPVVFAKARYAVKDAERALAALRSAGDFVEDVAAHGETAAFSWLRRGASAQLPSARGKGPTEGIELSGYFYAEPGAEPVATLGTVSLTGGRLILECLSRERLDWGKQRLAGLLGNAAAFQADLLEPVDSKLDAAAQARPERGAEAPEIDPEIRADLLSRVLHDHYTRWLDQPLPALAGRTPRQAATSGEGREALETLLRELENRQDHLRLEGDISYDSAWLRQELGLAPPG